MKKLLTLAMAVVFLAAAAGWVQTRREHTRPPYSGPRVKKSKKPLPGWTHPHPGSKSGLAKKGKADHILVR